MVEHLSLLEPRPMQHDTGDTEHRLDPESLGSDAVISMVMTTTVMAPATSGPSRRTHRNARSTALTDGHGERKEDRQAADGSDDARGRDLTGRRKAGEDRKHDPPDDIIHAGGNRDLAEVATHRRAR